MRKVVLKTVRKGRIAGFFFLLAGALTLACGAAQGQSVSLAWDAHSSHTNLSAYLVKYGVASGSYTAQLSVATNRTSATISNLLLGQTYYFAVVARDTQGNESQPSNEVFANTPPNIPPTLDALSAVVVNEDAGAQTINLTGITAGAANENQTLSVTAASSNPSLIPTPTINYASPNNSGTLTFTPVANAYGTATITVTVNDGQGQDNWIARAFTVTVNPINDAPSLNALVNIILNEDAGAQTVNLAGIASGAANEAQTLIVTATSSDTSVIPAPAVTYLSPNSTGSLTFAPVANASGTATITVAVNDGQSANNSVTRTFTITVSSVNDAPTLGAISNLSLNEDAGQQSVGLSGISSGAANEPQTLSVSAISSNPSLIPNPNVNYTSPNTSGALTFSPVAGGSGTATVTVTVNDGQSQNNAVTRSFTVTVSSVNDTPTLNAVADLTLNEDSGQQVVSLAGISSGAVNESQNLTLTASSSNTALIPNPTVTYTSPGATGSISFRPTTNASGTATITLTVNDGQATNNSFIRSFTVTVNPVNDLPTLTVIPDQILNENESSAALSFTVADVETSAAALTVTATSSTPSLISQSGLSLGGSGATRTLMVTPNFDQAGTAFVTVTVSDGNGGTASRVFVVTIQAVNQPPTLNALSNLSLVEDAGGQLVNLTGISSGSMSESQTLTVSASSSDTAIIPAPVVTYSSPSGTGTLTFAPVANASGVATVSVTVSDGQSQITRSFTVTVTAVNDVPTISDIANQSISQNTSTALIPFTIADTESPGAMTVAASSSNPTLVPVSGIVFGGAGSSRTIRVTPTANQFGSSTVTVTVADGSGGLASDTFVLTVSVANFPPTLDPLVDLTVSEDGGPQAISLTGITSGSASEQQTLFVNATSSNPSLIPNPTVSYSSPSAAGTLTFTSVSNAYGSAVITVTVSDGQSQNATLSRSFAVTITPANDAPTLNPIGNVTLDINTAQHAVALSGISAGAANENQTLAVTAVSSDPNLVPNPTINYFSPNTTGSLLLSPAANLSGTATITVSIGDGQVENPAVVRTFTVTIRGSNTPPLITDIADRSVPMNGSTFQIPIVIGDSETPANSLRVVATSSNPSLVPTNNISVSGSESNRTVNIYTVWNQSGVVVITLTVSDLDGASIADSFVVTVVAPNVQPTLDVIGNRTITEDPGVQTIDLTGISDGSTNESQTLTITASSSNPSIVPHPVVTYSNPDSMGTLSFTPMTNVSGSAVVTVTINDGQNQNNLLSRSFWVTITAVNDAPTVSAVPNQQVEHNTATGVLPFVVGDAETSPGWLGVSVTTANPTLVPSTNIALGGSGANRTITVTPSTGQSGTTIITILVTDGSLSAASSFQVTVGSTNSPPTLDAPSSLSTDSYTPLQNVPVTVTDRESRSEDLVLTASSFNQTVLPTTNIVISGTGSNRTVTLKPVAGKSGDVSVSFTVTDGRAQTRTLCQLNVQIGTPPKAKLQVKRRGNGSVQPALDGQDLTIGQSYTLTAVPASDELFTGWTGSVTSAAPAVTFIMKSNLVLEAGFTNNPYAGRKGAYNGLFHEVAEVRQESSGSFSVTETDRGTFTGKLRTGSRTFALSGKLDLSCKATNILMRPGQNSLRVELDFSTGGSNQVVGRVTDGVWEAPLLGDKQVFNSKTYPAPYEGSYTLIVPGQDNPEVGAQGDGPATLRVDANGLVTLAGTLADGTKIAQKVPLSGSGQWPLYIPLYNGSGSILSWVILTNRPVDDLTGLMSWIKPASSKSKLYPGGFTNETFLTGSAYVRPDRMGGRVLAITEGTLTIVGGELASAVELQVTLDANGKVTNLGTEKLTMSVSPATGLFTGSTVDPDSGKPFKFSGVVLQKQNTGSGFSLGTNRSSRATLE